MADKMSDTRRSKSVCRIKNVLNVVYGTLESIIEAIGNISSEPHEALLAEARADYKELAEE